MYGRQLFEVCSGSHVMLVYEDDEARLSAASHFVNEGLKRGELCIYASVHSFDNTSKLSVSTLSSKITDFELNVEIGNLKFIDFKPFYEAAVASNLSPFLLLKQQLETTLQERIADGKSDRIMVYADAACCLTENKQFTESTELEKWWQSSHDKWVTDDTKITVICPHPARILQKEIQTKWSIADAHDIMIFLNSHMIEACPKVQYKNNNLRILIAESEPDIMTLYSDYLGAMGHDVSVVTDGNRCLTIFKKREFDIVIVDTHLGDLTVDHITDQITRIEPHQRIIVTTTEAPRVLSDKFGILGAQKHEILQKPFRLSELADVITQKSTIQ